MYRAPLIREKTKSVRWLMVLIGLMALGNHAYSQPAIEAGASEVNITPPVGFPHYRGFSTGVHDSLYAKTLYFKQGEVEMALVECDLLWVSRELSKLSRLMIQQELGIPFGHVIIAGTHSHTTPAYDEDILELNEHVRTGEVSTRMEDGSEYIEWLCRRILQSVRQAKAVATEVVLSAGSTDVGDLSFNRRFVMADGRVTTNPGVLNPEALYPEGPIDPELGMLFFKSPSGTITSGLFNFSNHTDTKGGTEFSADFPAFLSRELKTEFGSGFISVYGQGACGNINHVNIRSRDRLTSSQIGRGLAQAILKNNHKLTDLKNGILKVQSEIVHAPLQHFTAQDLQWANQAQPENLYGESAFFERRRPMKVRSLARMRQKEAVPPTIPSGEWKIPLEIQAFQIHDDLAIVGLPGEVFVELGLAIKEQSPYSHTFVIELTNSHIAYVPTKEAFSRGGYETINSRLAPGGGEMMVESAVRLLRKLKNNEE